MNRSLAHRRSPAMPSRVQSAARHCPPLLAALVSLLAAGCALTNKSEPIPPRYFSPERIGITTRPAPPPAAAPPDYAAPTAPATLAPELRIGHISAASYLDERMVFRDSTFELGYYQEKRWTEAPEEYLRRRLERVLFEERHLRHVVGGSAPTLEVELLAFEEIRKPKRIARVQVSARLQDARLVRWGETLTVDQPVAEASKDDQADEMVEAVGQALVTLVDQIAERVTRELATPPAAPVEPPLKK